MEADLTAQSKVEAEIIALCFGTLEVLWLQKIALEIGLLEPSAAGKVYVENKVTIMLVQNGVPNDLNMHIDVNFNLVKD